MFKSLKDNKRDEIPYIGKLGPLSDTDLERVVSKIDVSVFDKSKCWIWNGTIGDTKKGHQHGMFWYNRKYVMIHRIMHHNYVLDVPEYKVKGLIVLHKCSHKQNGRCINPWHMRLGTNAENTQDAMREKTLTLLKSGEQNPQTKLTDAQVIEIMDLKHSGKSQTEIGKMYDVHQSQISRYWNKKTRKI